MISKGGATNRPRVAFSAVRFVNLNLSPRRRTERCQPVTIGYADKSAIYLPRPDAAGRHRIGVYRHRHRRHLCPQLVSQCRRGGASPGSAGNSQPFVGGL